MAEVNNCDLYCPRRALAAAEYRVESSTASLLKRTKLAAQLAVLGVAQTARAASCDSRNLEDYHPSDQCAQFVQVSLERTPISDVVLTEHEQEVLAPFLHPEEPEQDS